MYLVDMGLASKAYYANNRLSFLNFIQRTLDDDCVFAFDCKHDDNLRVSLYPSYKANRKVDDAKLDYLRQLWRSLNHAGYTTVYNKHYEADDCLYSLSLIHPGSTIVTGDKDMLSLVGSVNVLYIGNKYADITLYSDPKEVDKKYGFLPSDVAHIKALAGEATDNIPGVHGIGPVGAKQLIAQFGTIHELYKVLDNTPNYIPSKYQYPLVVGRQNAFVSYELASFYKCDVPTQVSKGNIAQAKKIFHDYHK